MIEPDFDFVFEDIIEVNEAPRNFLQLLEDLLPAAYLLMVLKNGLVLEGRHCFNLSVPAREELVSQTRREGTCFRHWPEKGWDCYGTLLSVFDAVLLIVISGRSEVGEKVSACRSLLDNTIELVVLKQQQEVMVAEKKQARREISILKKQHDRLIEDNYRQYRLNQDREKEYARKLETEIARQTNELREANSRLKEISRMKSNFLANMSHELRTPMNAIIGFADLLLETELDEEQADYTRTIKQSSRSLLDLINDILDLAKVEAGKLRLEETAFDLPELIASVTDMFRIQAREKGLNLKYEIDEGVPGRVRGDPNRLRQILVNLTGNAVKFTEEGQIIVKAGCEGEKDGKMLIKFLVTDTGAGISRDRIHAVFDNFTQADGSTTREYGGTGLGLSICQQLVDLMGGNIFVHSESGQGSTFCFVIPFFESAAEDREVKSETEKLQDRAVSGVRVLIVEDNAVNQRLVRIIAEQLGYEAEVASDGLEALERLKQRDFDIVFMDLQMPYMDGREATQRIREIEAEPERRKEFVSLRYRCSPLQVVGLTAHARQEDEDSCYDAGMNAFLTKPLVKEKMIRLLAELGWQGEKVKEKK
ncbi:MAG: ATP-binding protein [Desulfurivibrionaceae bacterium]